MVPHSTVSMTRSEIEESAVQAYGLKIERLLAQKSEREYEAIVHASRMGNRGAYLPALIKAESETVAATIRARTDAYLEAFARYGVPPDAQTEKDLSTFVMQVMGGANSGFRSRLALHAQRTRQPLDPGLPSCHFEIERCGNSALRESILRLRRQRTVCRLQTAASPTAGCRSSQVGVIPDSACRRKRGRPQTIPEARKVRALELKASGATNRQAAAELYDTLYPTNRQTRNVPSILRHYRRKSKTS